MIRRDSGSDWLFISQVDHAHLAADIAAVWGNDTIPPLPETDLLVPAVRDHDAGWAEWESAPRIAPANGKPRDFTEMPMPESAEIWSRSIRQCAHHSPLGGIWVSRHFAWLAEMAREKRHDKPAELQAIDSFLMAQQEKRTEWSADAARQFGRAGNESGSLADLIEAGFRWVQFFDHVSLWLCCAERTEPWQLEHPADEATAFVFTPSGSDRFAVQPFPLSCERLKLSVPARRIEAQTFGGDREFQNALSKAPTEQLPFELVPHADQ